MIPMQLNSENQLVFVVGDAKIVEQMPRLKCLAPFDDTVISFLNSLSKKLMVFGREYSDVATFGFWCRRGALLKDKEMYDDLDSRLGRGIIFHSTPSNVPVNFAFSFATGLLAGNANIIRLPAKNFEQVKIICSAINELLVSEYSDLTPYIAMVKYPPVKEITDYFSKICACRVVWGGDGTINEMRQSPLNPRANEINFADRHSIAIIDSDSYLEASDKNAIAQNFFNDTFFSDQNACTSPRVVFWIGKEKKKAKEEFWERLHVLVKEKYQLSPVQAVGKLTALDRVACRKDVKLITSGDNFIFRLMVENLDSDLMDYKYNSGFFFEYDVQSLDEILPIANERCQTLIFFGLSENEIKMFYSESRPKGIDRIVPMGKSMDFNLVWDGYDLIRSMSRRTSVIAAER